MQVDCPIRLNNVRIYWESNCAKLKGTLHCDFRKCPEEKIPGLLQCFTFRYPYFDSSTIKVNSIGLYYVKSYILSRWV